MKKFAFYLLAVCGLSVFALAACDGNKPTPPPIVEKDYPELAAVEGSYVISVKFEGEVCNDIVFPGNYNMADEIEYVTDPTDESLLRMKPVGKIDGKDWDGWFTVTIPYDKDSLQGKPVQLTNEGGFSWDYQTGDSVSWVIKAGNVKIEKGYSGESNLTFINSKTPIALISKKWKGNSPCTPAVPVPLTFKATVPEGLEADAIVYIAGAFNEWSATASPMTKGADGTWSLEGVEGIVGSGYKYLLNGDWAYEELAETEEGDECANGIENRSMLEDNVDVVYHFKDVTIPKCE